MMKRLLHIVLVLAVGMNMFAAEQYLDSCMIRVQDGDTMYLAWLHEVWVYPPMKFKNKKQEKFYWRTVRDVKKCLPYAKMISKDMEYADAELAKIPDKKEQKKWWRKFEKQLFKKYEKDFRNMYSSQGRMLMLLMDRETNKTSYELIRKYRGKAAVMGWNPGDEPAPKGITPQEMFRRYDTFKQIDPDHIAYTVICVPSQYANYAAGTDVLAPDPYPVPRRPVDDVYRRFKEAKAAANKVDTALWAVGQAFGGQKYDKKGSWPRWPNAREFRAMSYLSLMAGAKGIIYYTYSDGSFDIRQAPDLLEAVQKFPAEMRDIVPFVLDGKGELLAENADGVYAMAWTLGTERRLVAVNARDKDAEVSLPFSGGQVLFGAPRNLRTDGGRIRFTIPPLERVVIK